MLGGNCPRQLLFRFMTILKRKHIVNINSIKAVLAMVDSVVENCLIGTWQDGLILEICLGIVRVNISSG